MYAKSYLKDNEYYTDWNFKNDGASHSFEGMVWKLLKHLNKISFLVNRLETRFYFHQLLL